MYDSPPPHFRLTKDWAPTTMQQQGGAASKSKKPRKPPLRSVSDAVEKLHAAGEGKWGSVSQSVNQINQSITFFCTRF